MKKKLSLLCVLLLLVTASTALFAADTDEKKTFDVDINVGLTLAYNTTKITIDTPAGDVDNTLDYPFAALALEAEIMDYLTIGALAGFNQNNIKDTVDFTQLPLSLRFDNEKNSSMLFGLYAKTEILIRGDFAFAARGQYTYFKLHKNESPITLDIAGGTATSENSFSQLTLDLMAQYDGFGNITIFAGPQMNLITGEYAVSETLESLQGDQTLEYKQKSSFGLVSGVNFDIHDHFTAEITISLFSKTSLSANIFYIF
ncbi:MAG: autotransporter domain-containing protein [bacterium]|nr:autotransporter domain-containing protein [bacterium]